MKRILAIVLSCTILLNCTNTPLTSFALEEDNVVASDVVVEDTDTEKEKEKSVKVVKEFSKESLQIELEEKISLAELEKKFPSNMEVTLEDGTKESVKVDWVCESDYEKEEFDSYVFEVKLPDGYEMSESCGSSFIKVVLSGHTKQEVLNGTTFAIYSSTDNSLRFYNRSSVPTVGSTFEDRLVDAVYTGFDTYAGYGYGTGMKRPPWTSKRENILIVECVDVISPISTDCWFYEFKNCSEFLLSNLDTSNVSSMKNTFYYAGYSVSGLSILGLENWDVSSVSSMKRMFYYTGFGADSVDISGLDDWNTSNLTETSEMFYYTAANNKYLFELDLSNWDFSKVVEPLGMFMYLGEKNEGEINLKLNGWKAVSLGNSSGTGCQDIFSSIGYYNKGVINVEATDWELVTGTTGGTFDFIGACNEGQINFNLSNWKITGKLYSTFYYVGYNSPSGSIVFDLTDWDTSGVTVMQSVFAQSGSPDSSIEFIGIENFDTSNVSDMRRVFESSNMKIINIKNWNTSRVSSTNCKSAFYNCKYLKEITVGDKFTLFGVNGTNSGLSFPTPDKTYVPEADGSGKWYVKGTQEGYIPTSIPNNKENTYVTYPTLPITYTVKYNGNGSTEGSTESSFHTEDLESKLTANGFKKKGHIFKEWNTKPDGSGKSYSDEEVVINLTDIDKDTITLYAQWLKGVHVTLIYNDDVTPNETIIAETPSELPTPERDNYIFGGWYVAEPVIKKITSFTNTENDYPWSVDDNGVWSSGNAGVDDSVSSMISEEFTLSKSGRISFDWKYENGTSGEHFYDYLTYGIYNVNTDEYLLLKDFDGQSSSNYSNETYDLDPGTYQLQFMYGKDSEYSEGKDKAYVKNVVILSKDTYSFTEDYRPDVFEDDIALYAKWDKSIKTYTISYNGNGYTEGSMESSNHAMDVEGVLTANGYVREGYAFVGWNTKADGTGTFYADKESVMNLAMEDGAVVTLYAQWEPVYWCYVDGVNGSDSNLGLTPSSPVKTFKQAYENIKVNGGTIYVVNTVSISEEMTLDETYYKDSSNEISLSDGKTVLIKRYSKPTIVNEGFNVESNLAYMIRVNDNGNLTLDTITIDGHGKAVSEGTDNEIAKEVRTDKSMIYVNGGSVSLLNSVLQNNIHKYGGSGSAIYLNGGRLDIKGGTITENSSNMGGAICNYGDVVITGGLITKNDAEFGGAIYNEGSMVISGGVISNNNGNYLGGAIYNYNDVVITGGSIVENSSNELAGGIYNAGTLAIEGGDISNNTASDNGGGIYNEGVLTIVDGTIDKNKASYGGGIYNGYVNNNMMPSMLLSEGYMEDIFIPGTIFIKGGTISENIATYDGGGLYNSYTEAVVEPSSMLLSARSGFSVAEPGTVVMEGGKILKNTAERNGGGICNMDLGTAIMSGGTITENLASLNGGGVYNSNIISMSGGNILDNEASQNGNGIYLDGTLNISANALVDVNNDVYLADNRYITVDDSLLSEGTVAIITPSEYTLGRTCVRTLYDNAVASNVYEKFSLTPKNAYVLRPGDYIDESQNILDTDVVISEKYTISYDKNIESANVSNFPDSQTKYWYEKTMLSELVPMTEGAEFKGWDTNANLDLEVNDPEYQPGYEIPSTMNDNIALYAQWEHIPVYWCYIDGINGSDSNSGLTPSSPVKTFKQAYTNIKANGGTIYVVDSVLISEEITLDETYYKDASNEVSIADGKTVLIKRYSKPITVNEGFDVDSNKNTMIVVSEEGNLILNTITIDGHNKAVTEGNENEIAEAVLDSDVIIHIGHNGSVTLVNGILQNNTVLGNSNMAGAVLNDGSFTILGGSIINNESEWGGAIFNYGEITMSGGSITNNKADYGGAIYNSCILLISGGSIVNNEAYYGGAIDNIDELVISDGSITNNSSSVGGGIYNEGNLIIEGGNINNNIADEIGGGIYNYGLTTIIGGSIAKNTATYNGGGIYNEGILSVEGGNITENQAKDGGGVYNTYVEMAEPSSLLSSRSIDDTVNPGTLIMEGGTISKNTASNDGGGIYNAELGTLKVSGGDITENTASVHGGGVYYNSRNTLELNGGSVSSNSAYYGGGLYMNKTTLNVNGSSIIDNDAISGGGVWLQFSDMNLKSGKINDNSACKGGGIYLNSDKDNGGLGILNISGGEVVSNDAMKMSGSSISRFYGAGIHSYCGKINMTGGKVSDNGSLDNERVYGGGIYLDASSEFVMTGGEITGNLADLGGGVYLTQYGRVSEAIIKGNSVIADNIANNSGGGIMNFAAYVTVDENALITGNEAGYGGAIYNYGNADMSDVGGDLYIKGGTITDNEAYCGSAVYNGKFYSDDTKGGSMFMTGGVITENRTYYVDSPKDAVYNWGGTIEMSGGLIEKSNLGIYNDEGILRMHGDAEISSCDEYSVYQYGTFEVKDAPLAEQAVFLTPYHFMTVVGECTSEFSFAMDDVDTFENRVLAHYTFDTDSQVSLYDLDGTTKLYATNKSLGIGDTRGISADYPYSILLQTNGLTVVYDGNGATSGVSVSEEVSGDSYIIKGNKDFTNFSKEGSTFIGWDVSPNNGVNSVDYSELPYTISYEELKSISNNQANGVVASSSLLGRTGEIDTNSLPTGNMLRSGSPVVTLYAHWDNSPSLDTPNKEFYEGIDVKLVDLMEGVSAQDDEDNAKDIDLTSQIKITKIEYAEGKLNEDGSVSEAYVVEFPEGMGEDDKLDTWFMQLPEEKGEVVHKVYYEVTDSVGNKTVSVADVTVKYNNAPVIEAEDRYFSLEEAKSGAITKEFILGEAINDGIVKVTDEEEDGSKLIEKLDIPNFSEEEFKNITNSSIIELEYTVNDTYGPEGIGKEGTKTFKIHILEEGELPNKSDYKVIRFIDKENYDKNANKHDLVLSESEVETLNSNGGLYVYSIWYVDDEYKSLITESFEGAVKKTYEFSPSEVDAAREFIEANGIGNNLSSYIDTFLN